MNGLYIIPILAFLILIHEVGHFVTARMVGVKVEEFGIGIPPRLFGWTRNGVIWSINAIPFGGFVRVKGEDGANADSDSMNAKGPWQRAFFLVAGSFMNIVTAIVLIILLIGIRGVTTENLYVDYVEPNSPAAVAGWRTGDKIISAGGNTIDNQQELSNVTGDFYERPMNVVLLRGAEEVETIVTPRSNPPEGQGATGIRVSGGDIPDAVIKADSITPGSIAATAGLQVGDEFISIDGRPITDAFAALVAVRDAEGRTVTAEIRGSDDQVRQIDLAVPFIGIELTEVEFGSPAGTAGWEPDDRLIKIDGQALTSNAQFVDAVRTAGGAQLAVTVLRDGAEAETTLTVPGVTLDSTYDDAVDAIGANATLLNPFDEIGFEENISPIFEDVPASEVLPRGFREAFDTTRSMIEGVWTLITSPSMWDQVAGPVGMGQLTSEALEQSPLPAWVVLARIAIVLSLNLAVLNLLPLPALDGGRLFFVVIEILRGGRKIAPEKEGAVHLVGFVLLLGLMFVIAFFDIDRIRDGRDFIP